MPTQGSHREPLIQQVEQERRQGLDDLLAHGEVYRLELPLLRPGIQVRTGLS